ncbi:molybdopterin molybdotransferase MoeA [soil metagenome]
MITSEEALELVLAESELCPPEMVNLKQAIGRVLASEINTPFNLPRFANSAVDGYALSSAPGIGQIGVVRTIGAGDLAGEPIKSDECVKIFTGAPTPPGAYAVAMQEDCDIQGNAIRVKGALKLRQNIREEGEEFRAGESVLSAGMPINSAGIAIIASLGLQEVSVYSKPKIGIVVTGAELIPPGQDLAEAKIYESNSFGLIATLSEIQFSPTVVTLVDDDPERTSCALREAIDECDVLIVTGGVSVGDRDVVRSALISLGVEGIFWRVAIKPGKPIFFGKRTSKGLSKQVVFGLPGNPMAVLVLFRLFVQPYLQRSIGFNKPVLPWRATLLQDIPHKVGRRELVPGVLTVGEKEFSVQPILGQGSHMLGGLARANGLIDVPSESEGIVAGQSVLVLPFGRGMA